MDFSAPAKSLTYLFLEMSLTYPNFPKTVPYNTCFEVRSHREVGENVPKKQLKKKKSFRLMRTDRIVLAIYIF